MGRFTEQRHIAIEELGAFGFDLAQPVVDGSNLFTCVQHIRHVDRRLGDRSGKVNDRRNTALHIGGPDTEHPLTGDPGPCVVVGRHRVGVPTEHETPLAAKIGPSDQVVTDSINRQMVTGA